MKEELQHLMPLNTQGEYHGYHQWVWGGVLNYRGVLHNDFEKGYHEWHTVKNTFYYIR
jgi:hypothetical protein